MHSEDALLNSQRGGNQDQQIAHDPINPYRRKTYANPGKVRTGRPTSTTADQMTATTQAVENLSQTESNKTGDQISNSRSIGDGKQRRRRGDRSKGETTTPATKKKIGIMGSASTAPNTANTRIKKMLNKNFMVGTKTTP